MGERCGVGIRRAPSTSLGISPADSHPSTRKSRVPGAPANARKTAQLRLALPFRKLRVVLAQEDRGILYSTKLKHYLILPYMVIHSNMQYYGQANRQLSIGFRQSGRTGCSGQGPGSRPHL